MSQIRRDPITGRWIIVDTEKSIAPKEFHIDRPKKKGTDGCPFCPGNEKLTPPEVIAHRRIGEANTPGWWIRVVPNKYPALKIEGALEKEGLGVFDKMNGIGAHEVIIDSPDHYCELSDVDDKQAEEVIWAYIGRSMDLRRDPRFKYILIFRNYGKAAGASLEHPHSQLIALPIVPKRVNEEVKSASSYYDYKERCVFCDMLRQELEDQERLVAENEHFIAFAPFVSRFPYEVWIMPRKHSSDFCNMEKEAVRPLGTILRDTLFKLKTVLNDPPYNFIIHTSPINGHEREDYHWHIEIMPKLVKIAGFEWGSGFYLNPVPPEEAARNLNSKSSE
jgi:UDPglucose--hexose-1-phosphate uridylyltransferase